MRRWTRRLIAAAGALIVGAVFAGMTFLARPEVLLTDWTAGTALRHFGAAYKPRWSSLRFSAAAFERRRHRYALRAAGFCIDEPRGRFSACFSELEVSAVVFYSRRGPVLERIERLVAMSGDARLDLRRQGLGAASGAPSAALLETPIRALRIDLSSFTVTSEKTAVAGAFRAILIPGVRRPLSVAADVRIKNLAGDRRLKAEITAATDLLGGAAPTFIDLVGRADAGSRGRARAAFRVRREARRFAGTGSVEFSLSDGPLRTLRLAECDASAPLRPGAARPSSAELACRYELVPAKPLPRPFASVRSATGRAALSARLEGERFEGMFTASLDPVTAWCELTGRLEVRAGGRLDRPLMNATVSHDARADVKVPHFEDLVAFLRDTKYSVPAPVHVLKGPLSLVLGSRGDPRSSRPVVHYAFSSDLAGPRQKLVLRAGGNVTMENAFSPVRSFEHSGELLLREVALELPRLDIGRAPKVFFDKRIKTGDENEAVPAGKDAARPATFRFPLPRGSLSVKTEKPLLLFSNLSKDPVPLALDLVATFPPAAAAGKVSVRTFGVELFRRNAIVDHLVVALSSGSSTGALEGLIRYRTPETEIGIVIAGTTDKPRIELTSAPPMKREDIIALLIFGKSPEELDPEQTASVSNTETALESRAFGLASLYLFGATPIEHVGYDSATKTTSVRLRLPGGANLTLGSDFDQNRQLTVRKPLAPHWAIQSEITDQGQQGNGATTFLEWFNRY